MYADVIVDISIESLDKPYQYEIPERLRDVAVPGAPVIIPFGSGNRLIKGYIVGLSPNAGIDPARIKQIASIPDRGTEIEGRLIELAWWMKDRFGSTMNEALRCVIPVKDKIRNVTKRTIVPLSDRGELTALLGEAERRHYSARERLYRELLRSGPIDYDKTVHGLNISSAVLNKAVSDGIIRIDSEITYRNPFPDCDRASYRKPVLNDDQQAVADAICSDIDEGIRRDYLIHGVTGSGKTEVYMDVIDRVVASGRQVIMLIPEIALTFQTVRRFYLRFGDRISIMNSRLSKGERYDQYERARNGETDIVIGPRSALFTPFSRLGLIIIDEEHETSYRSENSPRYNAREVALHRAETEGASVILGSATPSVEAYRMAEGGRLRLFTLDRRAGNASLPTVTVADMREELKARNRTMFSRRLQELMADRLSRNEQIMLFLNRRGYSGTVSCRECGHVIKCPHCDVSMTAHRDGNMVCHYCGCTLPIAPVCPKCGSRFIGTLGIGTQKVEEQIGQMFPQARILRMDADSTRTRDSYDEILEAFSGHKADILIGTQMIVKGHDFPRVTLVGILLADLSLYSADFRAGERTFDLLAQAAGRAGRGDLPGDVVIQTYTPDHYAIVRAAANDYVGFYREEFAFRRLMGYPPSHCLLSIYVMSEDEQEADASAAAICTHLGKELRVIGPAPAPLAKANDIYRMIIYVKSDDYGRLVAVKDDITAYAAADPQIRAMIQYNFN